MARVGCIRSGIITGVVDTDIICVSDGIDATHQLAFDISRIHPGQPGNLIFVPSGAPEHDIFVDLNHITDIHYKASLHHLAQSGRFNVRIPMSYIITEVGEHRTRGIPIIRGDIEAAADAILATSGSAPGGDGRHIVGLTKNIVMAGVVDITPSWALLNQTIMMDIVHVTRDIFGINGEQAHPIIDYITTPAHGPSIISHTLDLISAINQTSGPISQEYRDGCDITRISLIALIIKGRRGGTASEDNAGIPAIDQHLQGLIALEATHMQHIIRYIAAHAASLPFGAHQSWASRLQGI